MPTFLVLAVLLSAFSLTSVAAAAPTETCEQIRARIGVPPLAAPELLRQLAVRTDCSFASADFYKAAYGDRPPAPAERHYRRTDKDDDD